MVQQEEINILDSRLGIYWQGNEFYPANVLENKDVQLEEIYCIRHLLEQKNIEKYSNGDIDDLVTELMEFVFSDGLDNNYQVCIEHSAEPRTRVRSYKGIINKKGIEGDYVETEIPFSNRTVIGSIIKLSEKNFKQNIEKFWDRGTSFILSSQRDYFSDRFLIDLIEKYRNKNIRTSLNYLELILKFCGSGDIIIKVGGYASDSTLNIDVFRKMHSK